MFNFDISLSLNFWFVLSSLYLAIFMILFGEINKHYLIDLYLAIFPFPSSYWLHWLFPWLKESNYGRFVVIVLGLGILFLSLYIYSRIFKQSSIYNS